MKQFNNAFRTKLYDTIATIENNSLVEVVVLVKGSSATYNDAHLKWGLLFTLLSYIFFMFSPIEFDVFTIFLGTILFFFVGLALSWLIQPMQKVFLKKKRLEKNTEIAARAIFQKGGVRHTEEKIGVLFYVSYFEKQSVILPDRGAETAVPQEDWAKMRAEFSAIFTQAETAEALIKMLENSQAVFAKYILPVENDINELPDDLDVDL